MCGIALCSLAASACGGSDGSTTQAQATTSSTAQLPTASAPPQSSAPAAGQADFHLGTPATTVTMSGEADDPTDKGTFHPATVSVHVGDIVEWDYSAAAFVPHNIVFADQAALSDQAGLGAKPDGSAGHGTWQVRFTLPGTYAYKCTFHPGMIGSITVGAH